MNKEKHDFFLHSNEVNHISKEDYDKIELLVNATKAFARSTYQCIYIIDYFHQDLAMQSVRRFRVFNIRNQSSGC